MKDMMPKNLEPRTVIYVLIGFVIVVLMATYFLDCDEVGCRGRRVRGIMAGRFTSLCIEE